MAGSVELPSDADVGEEVAPVGRDLHVEAHVVQSHGFGEGRARHQVTVPPVPSAPVVAVVRVVQQHDPGVVGAQSQLPLRTQHSFAALSANLPPADLETPGQHRPYRCKGVEGTLPHVRRPAHHGHLAVGSGDPAQGESVRSGMGDRFEHLAHRHVAKPGGQVRHLLHRCAAQRQPFHRLLRREADPRRQFPQPAVGDLHVSRLRFEWGLAAEWQPAAEWRLAAEWQPAAEWRPAAERGLAAEASFTRTVPGSACRSRRRVAGRERRGGASLRGPVPCRTPSPCTAPSRIPRSPARPDRPFPRP